MPERSLTATEIVTKSGVVKCFNYTKGYGFIAADNGSVDALVRSSVLEKCGYSQFDVVGGMKVSYIEYEEQDGRLSIDWICLPGPLDPVERMNGRIKFFNTTKGYGFIVPDFGGRDIFLHAVNLRFSSISPSSIYSGVDVSFQTYRQGQKVLANNIALL